MNRIARRSSIAILIALLLLAGTGFFLGEFVLNAADWVVFPGSPHVYNGTNIGCGTVKDADGVLLLEVDQESRRYASAEALRKSTVHWIGDRYGSIYAPALSAYASQMAGFELLGGVYSYGQQGGDAVLTLSGKLQVAALQALGDRKGTVAIYNYKTGELICAVTSPTYDPDAVPDLNNDPEGQYEGMYLNRFLQSRYIPGSIFKIVTLAAALEEDPSVESMTFTCTGRYTLGDDRVTCEAAHWEQSLKDAFRNSCNCAFAQISQILGPEKLTYYAEQFKITESVAFDGITTVSGNFDILDASEVNVAWSSIGQYTDQINPCRFLTFMGAIANDGRGVLPYVVESIHVDGIRTYKADTRYEDRIMSASTARIIREYLQNNVQTKYGAEYFPGVSVGAKTGTAEVGGNNKPNAMLAGFVADTQYPYAFIISVEDAGYGSSVCIPIISQLLHICRQ